MRRHDLDLTSLLAGIVFAAFAVVGLAGPVLDVDLDAAWVVPIVLIGLGLAGLLGTWARLRQDAAEAAPKATDPPDEHSTAPHADHKTADHKAADHKAAPDGAAED